MLLSLEGKVAVVTGASKGIGKAIAAGLAEAGASVLLTSRKLENLEAAAKEIRASGCAGRVEMRVAHAGRLDDAIATVATAIDTFGRLDILVNNAATNPYYGPTLKVEPSQFDKTMEVNLRGPIFWARAAYDQSFATSPGVIINISSVGGLHAENGLGVYNLSKAALIHLTRQLASELGLTRVVGIAPGLVQTDFTADLIEQFGARLAASLPTRRLGLPKDVANLAVFLASDAASWITGETIVIDGGAGVRASIT